MKYLPIIDVIIIVSAIFLGQRLASHDFVSCGIAGAVIIFAKLCAEAIRQRFMSRLATKEDAKALESKLAELQQMAKEFVDQSMVGKKPVS
jgi:hypothetical protein